MTDKSAGIISTLGKSSLHEPVNLSDLAITLTFPETQIATKNDAHKLYRWSVRIPADLRFGVAEHSNNAV